MPEVTNVNLRPCFCGSEAILDISSDSDYRFVVCSNEKCPMSSYPVVMHVWNRPRAYEVALAALREENERLRQLLQLVYERARHTVDTIEESTAWPFTQRVITQENGGEHNDGN